MTILAIFQSDRYVIVKKTSQTRKRSLKIRQAAAGKTTATATTEAAAASRAGAAHAQDGAGVGAPQAQRLAQVGHDEEAISHGEDAHATSAGCHSKQPSQ